MLNSVKITQLGSSKDRVTASVVLLLHSKGKIIQSKSNQFKKSPNLHSQREAKGVHIVAVDNFLLE